MWWTAAVHLQLQWKINIMFPPGLSLPLVQFQHLQSMLSEADPQMADMVRKQFPVWGAQQISVQHSSRLSSLLFIAASVSPPKILPHVKLFGFPLERLNEDVTPSPVADSVTKTIIFSFFLATLCDIKLCFCLKFFIVMWMIFLY